MRLLKHGVSLVLNVGQIKEINMKCEQCVEEGTKSRVTDRGSSKTLLGGSPSYYDEEGVYHHHDPNKITTAYTCSNGHTFVIRRLGSCPNEDCDYGKEIISNERM